VRAPRQAHRLWGAIILTVLRFIQGVGVGGEWGGSVLLSMSGRDPTNRSMRTSPGGFIALGWRTSLLGNWKLE
jgi:MFS family permease